MDYNQAVDHLSQRFKAKDWFYDIGQDQYGRIVVYVHFMNHETLHDIPDQLGKYQILVHFAASITSTREQFVDNGIPKTSAVSNGVKPPLTPAQFVELAHEANKKGIDTGVGQMIDQLDEEMLEATDEKSLRYLQDELDKLERLCGSYTLNDIFYEIQDGKNAVTNMSARYPEVRTRLEKLYKMYGFDVIYEELDG